MLQDVLLWIILPIVILFSIIKVLTRLQNSRIQQMMSRLDDLFLNRRNRFRSVFQGTLVAVLLVLFLIAAKSHKHESVWTAGELVVCADPTVWAALEDPLRKTFEHTIRTPQPETIFRIHRVEPDEFPRYRSSRYLVLLTTEEHRETFDFPQSDQLFMESETGFPMSRRGFVWRVLEDPWVVNQSVILIAGNDVESLKKGIVEDEASLYDCLVNAHYAAQQKDLPRLKDSQRLSRSLAESYGWTFSKPAHLEIIEEKPDENFVVLGTLTPGSWLIVQYYEGIEVSDVDSAWVIQKRNDLGNVHFGGQRVEERFLSSERSVFFGRPALVTSGLWSDDDPPTGGPFKNYTFYDPRSERVYMIDLCVFAPGKPKLPRLRVLEVIARTFETVETGVPDFSGAVYRFCPSNERCDFHTGNDD